MDEKRDNVIKFPKEKFYDSSNIQSREDFIKQITEYKTSFINDVSESLSGYVFEELARSGVDFDGKYNDLFTSMILVTESIKSLHLKSCGLHHPLQDFADDTFSEEDEETNISVDSPTKIDYNTLLDTNNEDE
jgi:hypothetical protein